FSAPLLLITTLLLRSSLFPYTTLFRSTLLDLLSQLLRLLAVQLALGLFNQGEHIAHSQNTGGDPIRVERFQSIGLFTNTQELDGLAGNMAYRQCGTATGITISLGQHHTGQWQRVIERLGSIRRILTGHGINHKQ